MATNFYMLLDGIEGASTDDAHAGEIELISYSHGVSQPVSTTRSTSGGATVERVFHQDFSITKYIDLATPDLNLYCCTGKPIEKIDITCIRADDAGGAPVEYMKYTMEACIVSSISIGGGGGDLPVETVSFNYAKILWNYQKQKEGGGGTEGNKQAGWDLMKNVAV